MRAHYPECPNSTSISSWV